MVKFKILKMLVIVGIFFIFSFLISRNFNNIDLSDKIVLIPIKGEIISDNGNGFLDENLITSSEIINYLEKADKDNSIKAIILEINSPGGSVIGSKEVVEKVKEINKPVVAWIREVGASGAYWVASASDAIVADELSITGSIGVIGSYLEFSELMDKYGVGYERLVTGKYKDTGSPYRNLSNEERKLLQNKLNIIHKAFSNDVSKNRKKDLSLYSNGEFFLGTEAKNIGLIDYLGGKELAINISKDLAKVKEAKIVVFAHKKGLLESLDRYLAKYSYFIGLGISNGFLVKEDLVITT